VRHSANEPPALAADRAFRIAVVLASLSVVPAARGLSPLTEKLAAGHGAGNERESRDAPGAAGLEDGFRMARTPSGYMETTGAPGPGADASRGSSSGNQAPERRGERSRALSAARCRRMATTRRAASLSRLHAERYGRSERTLAEPPLGTGVLSVALTCSGTQIWSFWAGVTDRGQELVVRYGSGFADCPRPLPVQVPRRQGSRVRRACGMGRVGTVGKLLAQDSRGEQ
jgi:hypothetical protein